MPCILFHLRDVPDDEAAEVRALLSKHGIDHYETSAGLFGISLPALWLRDSDDFSRARRLLDGYQQQRAQRMRAAYNAARGRGETSLWHSFTSNPLRFIAHILLIAAVLYLSLKFYLSL